MRADRLFRLALLATVLAGAIMLAPARTMNDDGRIARLGSRLICPCGCTQGALVCNHVGCPVVTRLRQEIAQRAQSSDSDDLVLQSFMQEYGSQVRAVPAAQGFNLLVWIMPGCAALAGLLVLLLVVRRWSARRRLAPAGAAPAVDTSGIRRQIESELDRELKG